MANGKSRDSSYGRKIQSMLDSYFTHCDETASTPCISGFVKFSKATKHEDIGKKIDRYFDTCEARCEVPSEAGLHRFLGISLQTLRKWFDGSASPDNQEPVQNAYARMTEIYLQMLQSGNKNMTPFVIFMLKQPRFAGYQDKIEARTDIAVNVKMGSGMDESDFK